MYALNLVVSEDGKGTKRRREAAKGMMKQESKMMSL